MENDDGRVVLVDIVGGAQAEVFVGLCGKTGVQQNVLRTFLAHLHMVSAVHSCEVDGARPIASCVHGTQLVAVVAHVAFKVDIDRAHLGLLLAACGSSY